MKQGKDRLGHYIILEDREEYAENAPSTCWDCGNGFSVNQKIYPIQRIKENGENTTVNVCKKCLSSWYVADDL